MSFYCLSGVLSLDLDCCFGSNTFYYFSNFIIAFPSIFYGLSTFWILVNVYSFAGLLYYYGFVHTTSSSFYFSIFDLTFYVVISSGDFDLISCLISLSKAVTYGELYSYATCDFTGVITCFGGFEDGIWSLDSSLFLITLLSIFSYFYTSFSYFGFVFDRMNGEDEAGLI